MENTLKYIMTLNVAEFKAHNNITGIGLHIKHAKDGGMWFHCGNQKGTVSKKFTIEDTDNIAVSWVETEKGEHFWLLHNTKANEDIAVL